MRYVFIITVFTASKVIYSSLPVIYDGVSIQEPGVFNKKCFYEESLSDHAPVLYKNFGTWNIAGPISHFKVQPDPKKPSVYFYNHKFFTDKEGNLLNPQGELAGFLGSSEVILLSNPITAESIKERTKNKAELKKQIEKGYKILAGLAAKEIAPIKNSKLKALDESYQLALSEISNDQENKYTQTLGFLEAVRRSHPQVTFSYIDRMQKVASKIFRIF